MEAVIRSGANWSHRLEKFEESTISPETSDEPESTFAVSKYSDMTSPSPSPQIKGRAKARICSHCGRGFRRTEHLERHVRTRKRPHWSLVPRGETDRKL